MQHVKRERASAEKVQAAFAAGQYREEVREGARKEKQNSAARGSKAEEQSALAQRLEEQNRSTHLLVNSLQIYILLLFYFCFNNV